jgi:hypothetical protein
LELAVRAAVAALLVLDLLVLARFAFDAGANGVGVSARVTVDAETGTGI